MTTLSAFEEDIIRIFGRVRDVPIKNLDTHVSHLEVTKRELTGVGIFVELNSSLPVVGSVQSTISGVAARINEDAPILGFLLYIDESKPTLLEGFSYSGTWPKDLSEYKLYLE